MGMTRRWSPSADWRHLILLQLPVRRLVRPHPDRAIGERHPIRPIRHPAAKSSARLHESGRRTERTETRLEILERLIAEVEVRVRREQRAVDGSLLQSLEDRFRLRGPAVGELVFAGDGNRLSGYWPGAKKCRFHIMEM